MTTTITWIGWAVVAVLALVGSRAAFAAFSSKDAKDIRRVLLCGVALCVLGPLLYAVAIIPVFTAVANADATSKATLLSQRMVEPSQMLRAAFAVGCTFLLTSGFLRAFGKR